MVHFLCATLYIEHQAKPWAVPVKQGITPPDSPKFNINNKSVRPAELRCTYIGNIGTIAKRSTDPCRLSVTSQPFSPENKPNTNNKIWYQWVANSNHKTKKWNNTSYVRMRYWEVTSVIPVTEENIASDTVYDFMSTTAIKHWLSIFKTVIIVINHQFNSNSFLIHSIKYS